MATSGFLITMQGTVRALEPWLRETSGSWRVKGQKEQSPVTAPTDLGGEREVLRKICICL